MTVTERVASLGVRTGLPPPPWTARRLSRPRNRDRRPAGIGGTAASGGGMPLAGLSMTVRTAKGKFRQSGHWVVIGRKCHLSGSAYFQVVPFQRRIMVLGWVMP
jgi:hypothetical protein